MTTSARKVPSEMWLIRTSRAVWARGIVGIVLCLVGIVLILQGSNVIHGSGMSGHGGYAGLGGVLIVLGLALLAGAWRVRSSRTA